MPLAAIPKARLGALGLALVLCAILIAPPASALTLAGSQYSHGNVLLTFQDTPKDTLHSDADGKLVMDGITLDVTSDEPAAWTVTTWTPTLIRITGNPAGSGNLEVRDLPDGKWYVRGVKGIATVSIDGETGTSVPISAGQQTIELEKDSGASVNIDAAISTGVGLVIGLALAAGFVFVASLILRARAARAAHPTPRHGTPLARNALITIIVLMLSTSYLAIGAVPARLNDKTTLDNAGLNTIDGNVDYLRASRLWSPIVVANTSLDVGDLTADTITSFGPIIGTDPKGAHTVVVYKEGSTTLARHANGTLISSSTNATSVINAALEHIRLAGGGGRLWLRAGNYTIRPFVNMGDGYGSGYDGHLYAFRLNFTVEVAGEPGALINIDESMPTFAANRGPVAFFVDTTQPADITLRGLTFDGSYTNILPSYSVFVWLMRFDHVTIKENHIQNAYWSIWGDNYAGNDTYARRVEIENNFVDGRAGWLTGFSLHNVGYHSKIRGNFFESPHTALFIDSIENSIISENVIRNARYVAIELVDAVHESIISDNVVQGTPTVGGGATPVGISFYNAGLSTKPGSNNNTVQGNLLADITTGIVLNGNHTKVLGNKLVNVATGIDTTRGYTSTIRANDGYATEGRGAATIVSGATSVTVSHGLATTPTIVTMGAKHAETTAATWSATSTQITFTVPSAVSANRDIAWYAEV